MVRFAEDIKDSADEGDENETEPKHGLSESE